MSFGCGFSVGKCSHVNTAIFLIFEEYVLSAGKSKIGISHYFTTIYRIFSPKLRISDATPLQERAMKLLGLYPVR